MTHSTPSLTLHQRMSPEHAPVPPRPREVLEPGPAHGHAQPSARAAGRHCGVVRLEGRPAVGREGSDVVRALHVSARVRRTRRRVCGAPGDACVAHQATRVWRIRRRVCGASGDACVARRGVAGTQRRGWHTGGAGTQRRAVACSIADSTRARRRTRRPRWKARRWARAPCRQAAGASSSCPGAGCF